jgi:hypothetical protein
MRKPDPNQFSVHLTSSNDLVLLEKRLKSISSVLVTLIAKAVESNPIEADTCHTPTNMQMARVNQGEKTR